MLFSLSKLQGLKCSSIDVLIISTYTFDMKFALILSGILSLLLLVIVFFLLYDRSYIGLLRSRAQTSSISADNSFLFTVPACGKAGIERQGVRMNIVVLTSAGLGKGGEECRVIVPLSGGVIARPIQAITDTYGKAIFDILASDQGIFSVRVECGGVVINENQSVCFE